ncbi:hypothetical protein Bca4012_090624 [Brassica carinata]
MAMSVLDCDLLTKIQEAYVSDNHSMEIIERLKKDPNAVKKYSWVQNVLRRGSKIVIPNVAEIKNMILEWLHCSSQGGHSGREVTRQRVKGLFYWKGLIISEEHTKRPEAILERKMVKRQERAVTSVLVQWVGQNEEEATWEFLFDLQKKFPEMDL